MSHILLDTCAFSLRYFARVISLAACGEVLKVGLQQFMIIKLVKKSYIILCGFMLRTNIICGSGNSSVPRFTGWASFSVFNGRTVNKAIRLPDLCSVYFWHVVRTEGFCNSTECQEVCSTLSPKRSQARQRFSGNCTCSHALIYGTHFLDQPHLAAWVWSTCVYSICSFVQSLSSFFLLPIFHSYKANSFFPLSILHLFSLTLFHLSVALSHPHSPSPSHYPSLTHSL